MLLLSLFLFAFYPLSLSVIGSWHSISSPTEGKKIETIVRQLEAASFGLVALSGLLLVCWAIFDRPEDGYMTGVVQARIRKALEEEMFYFEAVGTMLLAFTTKLYLMTVTGVDWMVNETAEQRIFEKLRDRKQQALLKSQGAEGNLQLMAINRDAHLNALVDLAHHFQAQGKPGSKEQSKEAGTAKSGFSRLSPRPSKEAPVPAEQGTESRFSPRALGAALSRLSPRSSAQGSSPGAGGEKPPGCSAAPKAKARA